MPSSHSSFVARPEGQAGEGVGQRHAGRVLRMTVEDVADGLQDRADGRHGAGQLEELRHVRAATHRTAPSR